MPAAIPQVPHTPWHDLFKYRRSTVIACVISLSQIGSVGVAALWARVFVSILKTTWAAVSYLVLGIALAGLAGQFVMSYLSDAVGRRKSCMLCRCGAALNLALAGRLLRHGVGVLAARYSRLVLWRRHLGDCPAVYRRAMADGAAGERHGLGLRGRNSGRSACPARARADHRAPSFLSPQATPQSILPVMLFLAVWYVLAGLVFWLLAMETKGRLIEEIDVALAPVALAP